MYQLYSISRQKRSKQISISQCDGNYGSYDTDSSLGIESRHNNNSRNLLRLDL